MPKVGYNASLVFYDSMLTDITTPERMDNVSSQGYAWGYIGSVIPFIISLVVVLNADGFGISMVTAMGIAFFLTAAWWLGMTIPLLRNYKQVHFVEKKKNAVRESFARLGHSLKEISHQKGLFIFLIAFFLYIDGVYHRDRDGDGLRRGPGTGQHDASSGPAADPVRSLPLCPDLRQAGGASIRIPS